MTTHKSRLVVLISGSGTNLQALIDASQAEDFPATIVAVGSDNPQATGLARAQAAGIATFVVPPKDFDSRQQWDVELAGRIVEYQPDWVVSAGFMRILGSAVLDSFPQRIINTHPALLPSFPGAHAVRDALSYGVTVTGCTVHIVDAGVDTGPVLAQQAVEVLPDDDEESVHERIKVVERQLLVQMVDKLCRHNIEIIGRKVVFS